MKAVPMIDLRPFAVAVAALAVAAPAGASDQLARSRNCVACHHAERHMNGPAWREIAARYANDEGAAARLRQKVLEGGAGNWGQSPMPPQAMPQEDADALVLWILSQK
jgi:cytochrome c